MRSSLIRLSARLPVLGRSLGTVFVLGDPHDVALLPSEPHGADADALAKEARHSYATGRIHWQWTCPENTSPVSSNRSEQRDCGTALIPIRVAP